MHAGAVLEVERQGPVEHRAYYRGGRRRRRRLEGGGLRKRVKGVETRTGLIYVCA